MFEEQIPERIELEWNNGKRDMLNLLGPSFWGANYYSERFNSCYRLLSYKQMCNEKREFIRGWIKRPKIDAIAPIVDEGYTLVNAEPLYFIHYEIEAYKTWADIIDDPEIDFYARLEFAISILDEFSTWRTLVNDELNKFLLPMPEDIIFVNSTPYLLAMPSWGQQNIEALFSIPSRCIPLPPEYVRGCNSKDSGRKIDIYAIGIAILQCLYTITETDCAELLLKRIANGSLTSPHYCKSRLPSWLEKVPLCQNMIARVRLMTSPDNIRGSADPHGLAKELKGFRRILTPESIVKSLIDSCSYDDALLLIEKIPIEQRSCKLIQLNSKLIEKYINQSLDAIKTLEQAISQHQDNVFTYQKELEIISAIRNHIMMYVKKALDRLNSHYFNQHICKEEKNNKLELSKNFGIDTKSSTLSLASNVLAIFPAPCSFTSIVPNQQSNINQHIRLLKNDNVVAKPKVKVPDKFNQDVIKSRKILFITLNPYLLSAYNAFVNGLNSGMSDQKLEDLCDKLVDISRDIPDTPNIIEITVDIPEKLNSGTVRRAYRQLRQCLNLNLLRAYNAVVMELNAENFDENLEQLIDNLENIYHDVRRSDT